MSEITAQHGGFIGTLLATVAGSLLWTLLRSQQLIINKLSNTIYTYGDASKLVVTKSVAT